MRVLARITLTVAVLLAGVPHALCNCPHAQAAAPSPSEPSPALPAACPHCDQGNQDREDTTPLPAKPCRCQQCDQIQALPAAHGAAAPSMHSTWCLGLAPAAQAAPSLLPRPSESCCGARPPGFLAARGCTIPILLERLLL